MRSSLSLLALLLAGCGAGATPPGRCATGACDRAFGRIVFVEVSSPGGAFRVLRDGTNQRTSFGNGARDRGVVLSRDELAPLWLAVDEPSFHADLKAQRTSCQDFSTQRCLTVSVNDQLSSGCWCGPSASSHVETAWQEALLVFDRAFP
ncbi:MAG: hypothetical protein AB1730_07740 [Myxococcota bacterium]|jgi:hypothetical protein